MVLWRFADTRWRFGDSGMARWRFRDFSSMAIFDPGNL